MFLVTVPIPVIVAGILVLLVLLVYLSRGGGKGSAREIDRLLVKGRYEEAARLALDAGRLDEALEYYLRAQKPLKAAQVAARLDKPKQAAELYERGGDFARAGHFYDQAGMKDRADEARRKAGPVLSLAPSPRAAPQNKAKQVEDDFRAAAAASTGSDVDRANVQELARDAAEALLARGEIRKAADIYREGGLDEEAIHLYVNVLGAPGEAAPLVARGGNHERAAELYELAGQKERAAASWVEVARGSSQPEIYVDRIERLDEEVAFRYLRDATMAAPVSTGSAELHYRLAGVFARRGDTARALETLAAIRKAIGDYKDIATLMAKLEALPPGVAPEVPPREEAAPRPIPPTEVHIEIRAEDLSSMAREAAEGAAGQVRRSDILMALAASRALETRVGSSVARVRAAGLEQGPVSLDLLFDAAVAAARAGPSIPSLRRYIGDRECDLQNIEVFYRMGLAQLAAGQWREALACFDAVEEASPGYRDADRRSEDIRKWEKAVGSRMTALGRRSAEAPLGEGRYALKGELGRGGMAVVYRAVDQVLGRDVALKFMSEEYAADHAGMREMFQREARSVAQLNHPNIVTIYDFGELEGRLFICMEYLDGKSVSQMTEEGGRLGVVEALRIVKQVLDALDYAHGRMIIHRDVKPSNMMRTSAGLVKLMDFGLAKSIEADAKSSVVAGTPEYMSPEQVRGERVDARSDLFSVGASLYEMLTGRVAFEGLERHSPPASVREHVPTLPPLLDEVVGKSLAFDPGARFSSAAAFLAPIHQVLEQVDRITAVGLDPGEPREAPAGRPDPAATVVAKRRSG